jgi:ammonia channel protein AmtB
MTSWECYGNKGFYMKYIGKMAETESLLSTCCTSHINLCIIRQRWFFFSYLTDFSYFPLDKDIAKVVGHSQSR